MPIIPDPGAPYAIVEETGEKIPNSYVQSCSECCFMYGPDGGPNIMGQLQRAMMTRTVTNVHGTTSWLDCGHCPVAIASERKPAVSGDGRPIYWKGTDRRVMEAELVRLEEDGNPLELYIEVR